MELSRTTLAIFAIVAAMGLISVVAIEMMTLPQDATARGCKSGVPFNASEGRCFHP
jgi:hypothetical protein